MVRSLRLAALAAVALLVLGCGAAGPAPTPTATPTPAPAELPGLDVTATVGGINYPIAIVDAGDAIWVLGHENATWSRIDPTTNTVTDTVGTGGPYATGGILVGDLLWSLDFTDLSVVAVDPKTREIADTIKVGLDGGWVVGGDDVGAVYAVGNDAREATRIDAKTHKATTLPIDSACGSTPATGGGALWMVSFEGHLCKLDPKSGKVLAELDGLGAAGWLNWASNRLLIPTADGGVTIVDPEAMALEATAPAPPAGTYKGDKFVLGTPTENIAVLGDGDSPWVRFNGATVGRLDLSADPTITLYAGLPSGTDAVGMAEAYDSLWFSDAFGSTVVRTAIP